MAKETIKVLEIDTKPAETSIKDLRKQLKGFKDEMANLDEGSDAFLEVARQAGEVKHQLDEINESVKGASSDFGDLVGNVTNVAAGITGAFQAVAGGLQAMGVESEAIDEAIAKMQGLMAVTQGLSAIDDGIKSFSKLTTAINTSSKGLSGFKKALIGTGLGALVVVLGSIIANWDEFSKSIGISETAMQKFGDVMKGVLNSALGMIGGVGKAISRLITGDFEGAGEAIKEGFAVQKNFQEGVQKAEEERTKKQAEEAAKRLEIEKQEAQKRYEAYIAKEKEKLDIELEKLKRKGLSEKDTLLETINIEQKRLKLMKEGTLEYEQQLTKLKELETTFKEPFKDFKIDVPEWITGADLTPVKDLSNALNIVQSDADKVREKLLEIQKGGNEQFEILKNTTSLLSESSLGLSSSWINSITDFQNVFNEVMDVVVAKGEVGWSSYAQIASASLQSIGTLLNNLSAEQDQNTIEGFKKQKELQIGATIMNTLSGIIAAWTSSMALPAPASFILGGIQTAATAALGAAQLAKIKEAKFGDNGNIAKPSTGGLSSIVMPATQYSQALQTSQLKDTVQDSRVYVVESDIKETGKKVEVIESENRY